MSSTYSPITYPAWTYRSLSNAYRIPLDATYTYFGTFSSTIPYANVYYTLATAILVPKNTHLEIVWASALSSSTTGVTWTAAVVVNGQIVASKTYNNITSTLALMDLIGTYLNVSVGHTVTIDVAYACNVAGISISWGAVSASSFYNALYAGTIVIGSGYKEGPSGYYKFPTLSNSQVRLFQLQILGTSGSGEYAGATDWWGNGTIIVVSANGVYTYLTQNINGFNITGTVVNVEDLGDFGDSSTPLLIGKVSSRGVGEITGPVLVLELDVEESAVILQNYPPADMVI